MSRFFEESSQRNVPPTSAAGEVPPIEDLLESMRSTQEQQVVSVRVATPALDQLRPEDLEKALRPSSTLESPASVPTGVSAPKHGPVSIPEFHCRLGGSGDAVLKRAVEVIRTVRTRLLRLQERQAFRSVVITSATANEGKTMISANLALCCAQLESGRILLIDADLRTSGLSHLLDLPSGSGLGEFLAGAAPLEEVILPTNFPQLDVICAGQASGPAPELLAGNRWRDLVAQVSKQYRLVLVDSPPVLAVTDFELISAGCEKVMTVVRVRHTRRAELERTLKLIDTHKHIGTVLNGIDGLQENRYAGYSYYGYLDQGMNGGEARERTGAPRP